MAILHPSLPSLNRLSVGAYRERDVVEQLEQGLNEGFDVFHNVDWSAMHAGQQRFGEVDVVVVAPSGHIALLEVKAGEVQFSERGASKIYGKGAGELKDIGHQVRRQHSALCSRLADAELRAVHVGNFLVLPDQSVSGGTVSYPRERVVDSSQMADLCSIVRASFPSEHLPGALRQRTIDFLANRFEVYPDPSTHIGQVKRASTLLAEGLATWVPRVTHPNAVYVVEATAGSGKSQLALRLLTDAVRQRKTAAYVCFNRPLADHMIQVAPPEAEISTFHEYCATFARSHGVDPDFTSTDVFSHLAASLLDRSAEQRACFDLLVVDESQDFEAGWVEALLPRLREGGRLYILGDPGPAGV